VPLLRAFVKLQNVTFRLVISACLPACMSVRLSAWNNSAATGLILIAFNILLFIENLPRKFKFHQNMKTIMGTLYEDLYIYL
jgi:hypothetical protein